MFHRDGEPKIQPLSNSNMPPRSPAELLAKRIEVMKSVRPEYITLCRETVDTLEKEPYKPYQCLIQKITEAALGFSGGKISYVVVKKLHNNWKSVEFYHSIMAPMPDPPQQGQRKEPPLKVETQFKIVKKIIFVEVYAVSIGEDSKPFGVEELDYKFCRPPPTNDNDVGSSSYGGGGKGFVKK